MRIDPKQARARLRARQLTFEHCEPRRMLAAIEISPREQLLLELVNRARANPTGEAALYGIDLNKDLAANTIGATPKQPLALNALFSNAARQYSDDMAARNFTGHVNPDGQGFDQRFAALGHGVAGFENVGWAGSTGPIDATAYVYENHKNLVLSAGHRVNVMHEAVDEIGIGIATGIHTHQGVNYNASKVTEMFGVSQNQVFITGVAFSDAVTADAFYTVNEGLGGITVTARANNGSNYQTQTGASGGYALAVAAGTYDVTFSGGALSQPITYYLVPVGSSNVKVDLNTSRVATLEWSTSITSVSENLGVLNVTLVRSGYTAGALSMLLTSSNTTATTVPAVASFEPGATSITVPIAIQSNTAIGGDQTVTITAQGNAASTAVLQLTVTDDDQVQLTLQPSSTTQSESGSGVAVSVRRSGATGSPLVVTLSSGDTTAATVPASVTIPANAAAVDFLISAVDDNLLDGSQLVRISAASGSNPAASFLLTILDNEVGSEWTNDLNSVDVNNDGNVTALDALLIINQINAGSSGPLRDRVLSAPGFYDVNGDEILTALDVLLVINKVNRNLQTIGG